MGFCQSNSSQQNLAGRVLHLGPKNPFYKLLVAGIHVIPLRPGRSPSSLQCLIECRRAYVIFAAGRAIVIAS